MNRSLVHQFIDQYKKEFHRVHDLEIYKWKAVKHFQENWEIDRPDFAEMLTTALGRTYNLMAAGKYFPRRVIKENARKSPDQVRAMFSSLYDEDADLIDRMEEFRHSFRQLHKQNFPQAKQDFQDHRAVMVYLSLRFPDQYFFYKYEMFRVFCQRIKYPYEPRPGLTENIGQFMNLCQLLREEISQDQALLRLHADRLAPDFYIDTELHILTQDFIYAVTKYLSLPSDPAPPVPPPHPPHVTYSHASEVEAQEFAVNLTPRIVDHPAINRRKKTIGDLGELWVIDYEKKRLTDLGHPHLAKKIEYFAKSKGDGAGYDIASFDEKGRPIFIEVKTTTGELKRPFFITQNELEKSKQAGDSYYLYRVYNFDEETGGNLHINIGDLSKFCHFPTQYKAGIKSS